MNILVLGSGGREHAIAWAIAKSPKCDNLYVAPGNGGTANVAENIPTLDMMNGDAVLGFVKDREIDLVVIGPEAPLVAGVADTLRAAGVPVLTSRIPVFPDNAMVSSHRLFALIWRQERKARGSRSCSMPGHQPQCIPQCGLGTIRKEKFTRSPSSA